MGKSSFSTFFRKSGGEHGSWNVYSLVAGLCLFLFAAICLASSFCIHNDEAKILKEPVRTITLPSGGDFEASFVQSIINGHRLESADTGKNRFPSMKSIPVDSLATDTDTDRYF
ncbi:unnamed protein product [Oikopleura dioica]|uniref:Uncharacterized protein n=1 Tax=Oikopleura dioica TaxID=34765 RepID=E4X1F5_OIKDI|nr:unnamed protein product [Oikopleura dioica]CBY30663.1 unnamed protein product [Oikopleura dioica]